MLDLAWLIHEAAKIIDIHLVHSRNFNGRYPIRELFL
jgi:hypothetical protein